MFAQHQGLLFFPLCPASKQAEGPQEPERDTAGQLTPDDPRDIPDCMTLCSVRKKSGKGRGGRGDVQSYSVFSPQGTVRCAKALLASKRLNTCMPMGSSE